MHALIRISLLGAVLAAVSPLAMGQVYRWVDHNGETHYSDTPHPHASVVDQYASTHAQAPRHQTGDAHGKSEQPPDADNAADARHTRALQSQVRQRQCQKARARLQRYQTADHLYKKGKNGKKQPLSADQQVNVIVAAKKQVAAYCAAGDDVDGR